MQIGDIGPKHFKLDKSMSTQLVCEGSSTSNSVLIRIN